jgi:molecular chaperone DnaK (HSP70)
VLFVDIGETSTNVSAAAFHKGQLKILATAHDRHLGGRNFDDVLVDHFAKEFQVFAFFILLDTELTVSIRPNTKSMYTPTRRP